MGRKKRESENFITFIAPVADYGYVEKGQRHGADSALRRWGALRAFSGVLVCLGLAVGTFVVVTEYIAPGLMAPAEEAVGSVAPAAVLAPIQYDTTTGLPIYEDADILFVVNENTPNTYTPELVPYEKIMVDAKVREALRAMCQKAEADGVPLVLAKGYLSQAEQKKLYDQKIKELMAKEKHTAIMARAKAGYYVAAPGYAESETGFCVTLAVDLKTFMSSDAYSWLNKYAADFGFIFRYPEEKEDYTGQQTDLRVLRYVGTQNAINMRQLGLCLEEYV